MQKKLGLFLAVLTIFAVTIGFRVQQEQKSSEDPARKSVSTSESPQPNVSDKLKEETDARLRKLNPRPQGVSDDRWIPLSGNVGIVLNSPLERVAGRETVYTGTIMVRATSGFSWNELAIENSVRNHKIKGD